MPHGAGRALRVWGRLYLLAVAVFGLWLAWAAIEQRHTTAHADDWRILDDFFSTPLVEWIFASQNSHRVPLTLALLALDYRLLSGDQALLVAATIAAAALATALLHRACHIAFDASAPVGRLCVGFAWFCVFWAGGAYYFLWGMTHGNLMVVLWLCVCLLCVLQGEARRGPDSAAPWPHVALVGAGAAALCATFSFGTGFSVWLALLAMAALGGQPWRRVAAIGACAALTLAVYSIGLSRGPDVLRISSRSLLSQPLEVLETTTSILGGAVGATLRGLGWIRARSQLTVSQAAGSLGLAFYALYGIRLWRQRSRPMRAALPGFGIMTCAVASCALVAFGRAWLAGTPEIQARFLLWSVLFWMGAVLVLPASSGPGLLRTAAAAGLPLLSLAMLPAMQEIRLLELVRASAARDLALALLLDIESEDVARRIFQPRADRAELVTRVARRLERNGRNLYADPRAALAGEPLEARFALHADPCAGSPPQTISFPSSGGGRGPHLRQGLAARSRGDRHAGLRRGHGHRGDDPRPREPEAPLGDPPGSPRAALRGLHRGLRSPGALQRLGGPRRRGERLPAPPRPRPGPAGSAGSARRRRALRPAAPPVNRFTARDPATGEPRDIDRREPCGREWTSS